MESEPTTEPSTPFLDLLKEVKLAYLRATKDQYKRGVDDGRAEAFEEIRKITNGSRPHLPAPHSSQRPQPSRPASPLASPKKNGESKKKPGPGKGWIKSKLKTPEQQLAWYKSYMLKRHGKTVTELPEGGLGSSQSGRRKKRPNEEATEA